MSGMSRYVFGYVGVTVETAAIAHLARRASSRRAANSALASTSAAAPSLVAQMSTSRSGSATTGDSAISSSVNSLRYRAFGLRQAVAAVLDLDRGEVLRASRRTAPCAGARTARSRWGSSRRARGTAASRGPPAARRAAGRRSPCGAVSAPTTSATSAMPGQDPGPRRLDRHRARTRTPRSSLDTGRPASRAPARTSSRRRSPGSRCASCCRPRGTRRRDHSSAGVGERGACRDHAVLDEVAAPLAPRVHARAEDHDPIAHSLLARSCRPPLPHRAHLVVGLVAAARPRAPSPRPSASAPTSVPTASWPSTIICSVGELHGGDAVRLERLTRRVRRRRCVPVVGERPQRAPRATARRRRARCRCTTGCGRTTTASGRSRRRTSGSVHRAGARSRRPPRGTALDHGHRGFALSPVSRGRSRRRACRRTPGAARRSRPRG